MNFLFRILGILDDAVNVVVVPTSVWHRMQDERNEALRERDETLRLLATRVEAKRLDDACAEVAALRAEVERLRRLVREGV